EGIPIAPKPGQKGKSEIDVIQPLALDEAADPDGLTTVLQLDDVEPEPSSLIHGHRAVFDVAERILLCLDTLVTDEPDPRRLIHELENERGIAGIEPADPQARSHRDTRPGRLGSSGSAVHARIAASCLNDAWENSRDDAT